VGGLSTLPGDLALLRSVHGGKSAIFLRHLSTPGDGTMAQGKR